MGKADPSIKPVTQAAGDLYLEELTKAAKRIGDTTDSAGAWLARFAHTNLQELSTGGWTDLLYEIQPRGVSVSIRPPPCPLVAGRYAQRLERLLAVQGR